MQTLRWSLEKDEDRSEWMRGDEKRASKEKRMKWIEVI